LSTYESLVIWIDSSCNGYEDAGGALRYGRRPDGTVVGNGDDPCVNHPNRVYATIRNIGDAPASAASITFEASDPIGVGVTGGWSNIGMATSSAFPGLASIPAGGQTTVYVDWNPTVALTPAQLAASRFAFHTCVRVRAGAVSGELVTSNLDGDGEQENIDTFEVGAGRSSGSRTAERSFRISNERDKENAGDQTYFFLVDADLPTGWTYEIADGKESVTLRAGEFADIPVRIVSSGALTPGDSWHLKVGAYTMQHLIPPSYVRTDRTEYLPRLEGGVDFGAQAVEDTHLSLTAATGKVLVVDGRLEPPAGEAQITLDYTSERGTISRLVKTDAAGAFHDASVSPDGLTWTVQAIWTGSDSMAAAVSDVTAADGNGGRSSWLWLLIVFLIGLVVGLLLCWLSRRYELRRRGPSVSAKK
jgi:hypothetical protein